MLSLKLVLNYMHAFLGLLIINSNCAIYSVVCRRYGTVLRISMVLQCNVMFSSETVAYSVYDLFCVCSTLVYIKLLLLWVLVLVADYLLEFRSIVYRYSVSNPTFFFYFNTDSDLDQDPGS
jgi:hypothetical protein